MATLGSLLSKLISRAPQGKLGMINKSKRGLLTVEIGGQTVLAPNVSGVSARYGSRAILIKTDSGYVVSSISNQAEKITQRIQIDG